MGITFAYELGWKSFLYEKSSTQNVTSEFNRKKVKHFKIPLNIQKINRKTNRKKVTGLLRSGGKKIQKISNLLVAHRTLGAPLVTE